MTISRRVNLGLSVATLLAAWPLLAQDAPSGLDEKMPTPVVKRTNDPSRRVPDHFGQLGLTPEQKESIYKIRGKHDPEIAALKKKITELQARMIAECETVLNDSQKQLLEQRRRSTAQARKPEATPAPSKEQTSKTSKDQPKGTN